MLASSAKCPYREPETRCVRASHCGVVSQDFTLRHRDIETGKRYLAGVDPVAAEGVFVGTHFGGWYA